jgi:hypothetical protein
MSVAIHIRSSVSDAVKFGIKKQRFGRICQIRLLYWLEEYLVPPQRWEVSTKLYGVT